MSEQVSGQGPDILWFAFVGIITFLVTSILFVPWLRSVWPWYNRLFR